MKCNIHKCEASATYRIAGIRSRELVSERYFCERHAHDCFCEFRWKDFGHRPAHSLMADEVPIDLEVIVYHKAAEEEPGCLYFHELGGERRFCSKVNEYTCAILFAMITGDLIPPTETHAGWSATIRELGGQVQDVVLDQLSDSDPSFEARLRMIKDGNPVAIGVRLSDACILAVMHHVPIFAVEATMHRFFAGGPGGW